MSRMNLASTCKWLRMIAVINRVDKLIRPPERDSSADVLSVSPLLERIRSSSFSVTKYVHNNSEFFFQSLPVSLLNNTSSYLFTRLKI